MTADPSPPSLPAPGPPPAPTTALPTAAPDGLAFGRFCLHCNQPLDGIGRNHCPKCGLPFDPLNPRTYARMPHSVAPPDLAASLRGRLAKLSKASFAVALVTLVFFRYAALHWTDCGWCFVVTLYPVWVGFEVWLATRLIAGEGRSGGAFWFFTCVALGLALTFIDAWLLMIVGLGAGVVVWLVCIRSEM